MGLGERFYMYVSETNNDTCAIQRNYSKKCNIL